jgi:hypothetical protein
MKLATYRCARRRGRQARGQQGVSRRSLPGARAISAENRHQRLVSLCARGGQRRDSCPRTDDPAVEKLRSRQAKNFLSITMLSLGVPIILMGDEARHSQHGNNNAYCQDNETGWFDWTHGHETCRAAPLREVAHRTATSPRRGTRTRASESEPTHPWSK